MSRRSNKNSYREEIQDDLDDYDDEYNSTDTQQGLRQQLLHAIQVHDIHQVRSILSKGINLNYTADHQQESPLHLAAVKYLTPVDVELLELLVYFGASVHARNRFGITPLLEACRTSSEYVRVLLDTGSRVNDQDNAGRSALFYACMSERPDALTAVQYLLDRGANVHIRDEDSQTALHYICCNKRLEDTVRDEIVHKLLYAGLGVNSPDNADESAVHMEMRRCHVENMPHLRSYVVLNTLIRGGGSIGNDNVYVCWLRHVILDVHRRMSDMNGVMSRIELMDLIEFLMAPHMSPSLEVWTPCDCVSNGTHSKSCPNLNFYKKVKHSVRNANSLKYLSRSTVRHSLRGKVYPGVEGLTLPSSLKDYILLRN